MQALKNALVLVQGVLNDPASSTQDLITARGKLSAAVAALIKTGPNRSEYKKTIADEIAAAEAKDLKGYTAQSVQAFQDALIYAKAVLNNQEASEADYKKALAKLKDAAEVLRKDDPKNPDKDTDQNNSDKDTNQNKDSGDGNANTVSGGANTGDSAQPAALAVLMLLSLTAGIVLLLRKRRQV